MASLEIREDLFYEYVVIWGRGERDLSSSLLILVLLSLDNKQ